MCSAVQVMEVHCLATSHECVPVAGTSVASSCLREVEDLDIFRNGFFCTMCCDIIVCEANETYVGRSSVRETGPDKTFVPQDQLVASVSWLFREMLNPRLTLI